MILMRFISEIIYSEITAPLLDERILHLPKWYIKEIKKEVKTDSAIFCKFLEIIYDFLKTFIEYLY